MTARSLRPDQTALVDGLDAAHQQGHRCVILQLPTGGGKSVVLGHLAAREAAAGPRLPGSVVVISHLAEINKHLDAACAAAGCPDDGTVVVTSIQAIEAGTTTFPNARMILGDEWHRAACASVQALMARHPGVRFVAFTATPARSDGKPLAGFTHLVQGPQVRELVALGLLAPITVLAPREASPHLAQDPVAIYPEGRPGIIFAGSIAHSVSIAEQLRMQRRIVAEHVDGSPAHARRRADAVERFNAGLLQVLTCQRLLAEGVDLPAAEVCVLASPVTSTVTFLQCLDAATQVLTRRGFMGADDVRDDDEIAAFDPANGAVSWSPILSRVDRSLGEGEWMFALRGPSVDVRVTGGHRMLYARRQFDDGRIVWPKRWALAEAAQLATLRADYRIPIAGEEEAPGASLTDAQIRFIGWFLTDGTMNASTRQVRISQAAHQPQIEDLRTCLRECGFDFKEYRKEDPQGFANGRPQIVFCVPKGGRTGSLSRNGWASLATYLDKDFAPELEQLDRRQLGVLLEAIHLGDGSKQLGQTWTRRSYHVTTGRRTFADRLQSLCVRRGFKCNVVPQRAYLMMHIKATPTVTVGASSGSGRSKLVPDDAVPGERVWCVETTTGTIITRRNGKVAIVGNCIGRVRRPRPGKRALLLDLCGSVHLHGLPDEDRTYHLEGGAIRLTEEDRTQAATQCSGCLAWMAPSSRCPDCGHTSPPAPPPRVLAKDMIEQRAAEPQDQKRRVLARFVADAVRKGHNPWSAAHRFRGVYGHAPPREWMAAAIAGRAA